jgi:hypothetical protein
MIVGTATGDIGNLRFYQRRRFRLSRIERDALTPGRRLPGRNHDRRHPAARSSLADLQL